MLSKSTLLFIGALAAVAAKQLSHEHLHSYTFEQFVTDFGLSVTAGSDEYNLRQGLFNKELARVLAHNTAGKSWKETINRFSVMTPAEMKAYKGYHKGVAKTHVPKNLKPLPKDFVMKPVSALPTSVDWRDSNVVSAVKDQGSCGSCWAFASTATIESHVALASGQLYDFSVERTAFCTPNPDHCGGSGGCGGATAELAFDYLAGTSGVYQEYQQGYTAYRGKSGECGLAAGAPQATIDGYVKLAENNYTALMNAVAQIGPISVSVDAAWGSYSSGVFHGCDPSRNVDIDHAVVLVGYGEENGQKYWTIRNSWSPAWGEVGYIRLARSDDDDTNCATDSTPQDGSACAGETDPIKVCGTCGVLYDSSYPTGAAVK